MSRSVGIGTCSRFLEWRMFFVGEPVSTSPEHALGSRFRGNERSGRFDSNGKCSSATIPYIGRDKPELGRNPFAAGCAINWNGIAEVSFAPSRFPINPSESKR
jgi:hypothetical protein